MTEDKFIPLEFNIIPEKQMLLNSRIFLDDLKKRRTVREFSEEKPPEEIVINCIKAALSAPSGANKQPWHFVLIKDSEVKENIREAAEAEEKEFYSGRASDEWIEAVKPFGTNEIKEFLTKAPYLIAIFAEKYEQTGNGKLKNYYVSESVGIATGMFITALHFSGLASLTHTPSPMNFLNRILDRPENEKPFLLLVTGYPKLPQYVPDIKKKDPATTITVI